MSSARKFRLFSKPFDATDYKELKRGGLGPQQRSFSVNDREEIRKRLAMDADNEECVTNNLRLLNMRKSNVSKMQNNGSNIQICFMSEGSPNVDYKVTDLDNAMKAFDMSPNNNCFRDILSNEEQQKNEADSNSKQALSTFTELQNCNAMFASLSLIPKPEGREEFSNYHSNLYAEARIVLSHAKSIAKMKMQFERTLPKRTALSELLGLPFRSNWKKDDLLNLGVSQLQVIVNDFHTQIETLNEYLVKMLLERDELHMEQDSILVDIEDLTVFLVATTSNDFEQTPVNQLLNQYLPVIHRKCPSLLFHLREFTQFSV